MVFFLCEVWHQGRPPVATVRVSNQGLFELNYLAGLGEVTVTFCVGHRTPVWVEPALVSHWFYGEDCLSDSREHF